MDQLPALRASLDFFGQRSTGLRPWLLTVGAPRLQITIKFPLPSALKGAETLYRGRLWLDAETAQLRREERDGTGSLVRKILLRKQEVTACITHYFDVVSCPSIESV
jgi:hypothetical protein